VTGIAARSFGRVLVANRGEIALRVVRACRDSGLESVAVYADQDAHLPFVRAADHSVPLDGRSPAQTYLNVGRLLAAARQAGADALHPGYGFLAENHGFARTVLDAGLVWVGPPPDVIAGLGDKVRARGIAAAVGAPLLPGTRDPVADAAEAVAFAERHGLPVAIKAVHGGGGRGMRVARELAEVAELFTAAAREAATAFGNAQCFVEPYVEHARHVEAQVLADAYGEVAVVGTRDCSLQRRFQKLVEEAPAPFLSESQRRELERAAAAICRAAGYVNAGTVEFLLSPAGNLAFLEVNTRLQVEHTVTEETADVDLVRAQLMIAAGSTLNAALGLPDGRADPPVSRRHSIQLRINAENPAAGFVPSAGTLTAFRPPTGPGVRLDTGVLTGNAIGDQFDSLLAKLVVTGHSRAEAIQRARRALDEFEIEGVPTTLPFLRDVLRHPAFAASAADEFRVHTCWVEEDYLPTAEMPGPGSQSYATARVAVRVGTRWLTVDLPGMTGAADGPLRQARRQARERLHRQEHAGGGELNAPMQGTVTRVMAEEGQHVAAGQVLMLVEAMKMENPLRAPHAGIVTGIQVVAGDTVRQGEPLCKVSAP